MSHKNLIRPFTRLYLLSLFCAYIILLIRAWHIHDSGDLLFNDDIYIYLNAAHRTGIQSLFLAFAGYLNTIIRIFVWVASLFPYIWQPVLLLGFTLLIYAFAVFLILSTLKSHAFNDYTCLLAVILLFIIPSNDDVYLNITNSQWLLGVAFIIYMIASRNHNYSPLGLLIVFILGINGPYSIFILPALLFKNLLKPKKQEFVMTGVIAISAFINIYSGGSFGELNPEEAVIDSGYSLYLAKYTLLAFFYNLDTVLSVAAISVISLMILYKIFMNIKNHLLLPDTHIIFIAFLMVSVIILTGFIVRVNTMNSIPFGPVEASIATYNRYLFIPHYLFIIGTVILLHDNRRLCTAALACFTALSLCNLHFFERDRIHFYSYANLANYQTVLVPGNYLGNSYFPKSKNYMSMGIQPHKNLPENNIHHLTLSDRKTDHASIETDNNDLLIRISRNIPEPLTLTFEQISSCNGMKDIALDYGFAANLPIRLEFLIVTQQQSQIAASYFFYPIEEQFQYITALPYIPDSVLLIRPYPVFGYEGDSSENADIQLSDLKLYCLPAEN